MTTVTARAGQPVIQARQQTRAGGDFAVVASRIVSAAGGGLRGH